MLNCLPDWLGGWPTRDTQPNTSMMSVWPVPEISRSGITHLASMPSSSQKTRTLPNGPHEQPLGRVGLLSRVRFPYGTPKLSIIYKKSRFHPASNKRPLTPCLFANARHNHLDNIALRLAFLVTNCLNVSVHRDFEICRLMKFGAVGP